MSDKRLENLSIRIFRLMEEAKNIVITAHENPDGDALASVCVFIELCERMGKAFSAVSVSSLPENLDYLPRYDKIMIVSSDWLPEEDADLFIAVDCAALFRCGLKDLLAKRTDDMSVVSLDHHILSKQETPFDLRNDTAASTTEVIYDFLRANGVGIDKDMANCILTGILTDTGNFLYSSTSEKTMEIASEMLSYGARLPRIIDRTWRNKSLDTMKVWGKALSSLRVNQKYNIAYAVLTRDDMTAESISESDLDGISGFLGNLYGVKAVMLLREEEGGILRGSLRTSDDLVDVSKLANALGGGGHKKASGFKLPGRLERRGKSWRIV